MKKPDFNNLLKVLEKKKPARPTLFEFFLNNPLYSKLAGYNLKEGADHYQRLKFLITAFKKAGYDYATINNDFHFPSPTREHKDTVSLNSGGIITDYESFKKYPWPDPDTASYSFLDDIKKDLPSGMKLIIHGPCGVLENVTQLVGYEKLCYLTLDNPKLLQDIFAAVGSRLQRYYEITAKFDTVGALISNDDWGFKTQTMLSHGDMKKYVYPWHQKIVETIHQAGKPAILHSCGNLAPIMDDIIDVLKYDGKHSYEDTITPVEEAYDLWGERIAILGGIDLNFICTASIEEIKTRSIKMLEKSNKKGSYALGTGNSVPEYVPDENYFAMIETIDLV